MMQSDGRLSGAIGMWRAAVEVARREHHVGQAISPLLNLGIMLRSRDIKESIATAEEATAISLQTGLLHTLSGTLPALFAACWLGGAWDRIEQTYLEHRDDIADYPFGLAYQTLVLSLVRDARGQANADSFVVLDPAEGAMDRPSFLWNSARIAETAGDLASAARSYAQCLDDAVETAGLEDDFTLFLPLAVEGTLAGGLLDETARLLRYVEDAPVGLITPLTRAHLPRLRALLAIATGGTDDGIDADLELATLELRAFGATFYLARTLLERADRLVSRGNHDDAEPLRREAEEIFTSLRAAPWVDKARALSSVR
jgi:hypothetical protein